MGLYRTWTGKLNKRKGQLIAISTAGEPGSEFEAAREAIRQTATVVERGPAYQRLRWSGGVMHEYAVPEDGDVEDLALVKDANPFSGITVDSLRAKRDSPTETLDHWLRFTCNRSTRGVSAAITEAEWAAAATIEEIPEGQTIWAGFDAGWKLDTSAIVPLWVRDFEFRLFGPAVVLTPPRDGNSLSPDDVKRAFLELHARTPIEVVVMDIHRAEEIKSWLESIGIIVVDRSQSNVAAATDYEKFMEALRNGWLKHSGDDALRRHALNAVAHVLPDGKVKFERPSQSRNAREQERRVIDALQAGAMVHTSAAAELGQGSWGVA
jgi:phage terminase large subunit-like protein